MVDVLRCKGADVEVGAATEIHLNGKHRTFIRRRQKHYGGQDIHPDIRCRGQRRTSNAKPRESGCWSSGLPPYDAL
jgi:hypothetical protein